MKEKKRHEIFIEKGMRDGQRIVLHGEGDQTVCFFVSPYQFILMMSYTSLILLLEMSPSY